MSEVQVEAADEKPRKKGALKLMLMGVLLALILGGGGFYAVYSGLILGDELPTANVDYAVEMQPLPDVTYIELEPMVINLGRDEQGGNFLRFRGQLEVGTPFEAEVRSVLPRVIDVLNSYLRAVDLAELEDRTALIRLRAQMLRRIKMVVGTGRVNDLLIMEFVMN